MSIAENQRTTALQTNSTTSLVLDVTSMESMVRVAELMATGRATIPKHLQGNSADCLAVVMQSMQWGMNPFAVAQKTHVVQGTLGYEAQLVNAVIISRAPVEGRLEFEWFGPWEKIVGKFLERESKTKNDDNGHPVKYRIPGWSIQDEEGLGVIVSATFRGEPKPRVLELLLKQARVRNSTLWADDPKQQLAYLAIKRWSRLYCPDVIMGVYTPDEIAEFGAADSVEPFQPGQNQTSSGADKRQEKIIYSDEQFDEKFPEWEAMIKNGSKTHDRVLKFVQSKAALTEAQIKRIRDVKRDAPADAATTAEGVQQ